jgi:NAD+ synthase (glutamine-hydrolysing)
VQGLAKRLQATKTEKIVIGVSGGLDSTQALIVSTRAMIEEIDIRPAACPMLADLGHPFARGEKV